mgnify:FL=1
MRFIGRLKYAFYVIFHPFKGFWELKSEKRGSLGAGLTIFFVCMFSNILRGQFTGYLFNKYYPENADAFLIIIQSATMYFLWCIANWCLTTLMNVEGTGKEILTAVGYCLLPLIFANILVMLLSNTFSLEESTFLLYIDGFAYLWTGFLIFSATAVIHQFSASKTVLVIVLTVAVMVILVFIGLLCISLVQQFLAFVQSVYSELAYRL